MIGIHQYIIKRLNCMHLKCLYSKYKQKNISSAKKELIETYGGQSFYDAGVRAYYLYSDSFIYDEANSINNSEVKCTHSK